MSERERNPIRTIEDLNLSPAQLEAIETGRRAQETRRQSDENAAQLIADNNPPFVPMKWYARIWTWIKECL